MYVTYVEKSDKKFLLTPLYQVRTATIKGSVEILIVHGVYYVSIIITNYIESSLLLEILVTIISLVHLKIKLNT